MPRADTPALSPEATLRAIFAQAFRRQPLRLPPGATVRTLRQAVALDAATASRIFQEEQLRAKAPAPTLPRFHKKARIIPGLAAAALVITCIAVRTYQTRPAPPDPSDTLAALQARAQAGNTLAEFSLATLLDSSLQPQETLTPKNNALAAAWYRKAADAGLAAAQNNFAYALQTGHGVPPNPTLAAHYYSLAAKQNLPTAANSLGLLYQAGLGVPRDDAIAASWFRKAAAENYAPAQNSLGVAYRVGRGVPQSNITAAAWLTRAAAQGEPNAQNNLGILYYNGYGVAQDFSQAAKYFTLAATAGNPAAAANLAGLYYEGDGVPKDNVQAAKWLIRAAAHGAPGAAGALASLTTQLTPAQLATAKAEAGS